MIVFNLLKKKRLQLKYSLLWLVMGIIMALLVLFPGLLNLLCNLFGIVGTMNGLFCFSIGFILMLLMALTSIVSRQSSRITRLVQENALLEKKIRDLEFYKNSKELNEWVRRIWNEEYAWESIHLQFAHMEKAHI